MILRSFLFSLKASYRFLNSTCYLPHLDCLSAENMILDMISCAISIYKVSFRSVIWICQCDQLVHFSTENIILSSKTSPWSIWDGNFLLMIWACFYAKIVSRTLKRRFCWFWDRFFSSLQTSYRFLISRCYFSHLDCFEQRKHDFRLAKLCHFHLQSLFKSVVGNSHCA